MKSKSTTPHLIPCAKETLYDTTTSCEQLYSETIMAIVSQIADVKFQGNYQCVYPCDKYLSTSALNNINTYLLNRGYHSQINHPASLPAKIQINWDLHNRKES